MLDDLVQAATRLIGVVDTLPAGALGNDPDVDEVVLWNLTVLGEASKRLSATTRERFSHVPWSQLARTRNFLVHHYDVVDWSLIEQICSRDLPALLPRLAEARDRLRAESDTE